MIKKVDEYISKLLAVPYSHTPGVSDDIYEKLNKDFYTKCFIKASYNIKDNILEATEPVKTAFEIDLTTQDILDRIDKIQNDENTFMNWLENTQNTPYYVRGDAGTGKTAYLHWLKFHLEQEKQEKGLKLEIIDISEANDSVKVLDIPIKMPDFKLIYYKVISAIIKTIEKKLIIKTSINKSLDDEKTYDCFFNINKIFSEKFAPSYPDYRVTNFFTNLPLKTEIYNLRSKKQICEECGRYLAEEFIKILKTYEKKETLEICLQIYMYILACLDYQHKYIIAIDNVERIIGVDELYNIEITKFASSLRNIQNNIIGNSEYLHQFYKIVVFMRNTTVRTFTPQQISDIRPSTHDMSEWFDTEAIILKKIEWYEENNISLESSNEILNILRDNINDNGKLRGLYTKISMIFNNNKRAIVHFLVNIFGKESNRNYIEIYNKFCNQEFNGISTYLNQFAARSIIYRLLLNEMRKDDFFHAIMTESETPSNVQHDHANTQRVSQYGTVGIGYARRILTLVYNYNLANKDDPYMPLSDILIALFNITNGNLDNFYSTENFETRDQIAGILFAMNYYDGRNGDWLQFIDIQYLPTQESSFNKRIPNSIQMRKILEEGVDKIKIKITTSGIAYLYFIAPSYEYFSCKSIHSKTHRNIIGNYDIPPLLCAIPTEEEIMYTKISEIRCIRIIKTVLIEALKCITKMNQDEQSGIPMMPFKKEPGTLLIKHADRIVNSHKGYINNFLECIGEVYDIRAKKDVKFKSHLEILTETICELRNLYQSRACADIDVYKNAIEVLLKKKQLKKKTVKDIFNI